jgi:hypothetical protein
VAGREEGDAHEGRGEPRQLVGRDQRREPITVVRQADPPCSGARPLVEVGPHPRPDLLHLAQEDGGAGRSDALDPLDEARGPVDVAVGVLLQQSRSPPKRSRTSSDISRNCVAVRSS